MPRRELKYPHQITHWLVEWGIAVQQPSSLILIGSGGLLWHAAQRGLDEPLPENSMDVDPITDDEEVARLGYDAMIGSEFELANGWHVKLMPKAVLRELPGNWEAHASRATYGRLTVVVPAADDLLVPKLKRGEPRDLKHAAWARQIGLVP
jgi:hypothetical protein